MRAAGPLLAGQDRPRYRGQGAGDVARAEALVVAACGLVREPARAVDELCWMLPDPAAAEVSLAELLAERTSGAGPRRRLGDRGPPTENPGLRVRRCGHRCLSGS